MKLMQRMTLRLKNFILLGYLRSQGHEIDSSVQLGLGCLISAGPGAKLVIKKGVRIDANSSLILGENALMQLGEGTYIGRRNIISSMEKVILGENCMTAHQVSILDSSHNYTRAEVPMSQQGQTTSAVEIGDNVWLGLGVAVLSGSKILARTIVSANSVVIKSSCKGAKSGQILSGNPAAFLRAI